MRGTARLALFDGPRAEADAKLAVHAVNLQPDVIFALEACAEYLDRNDGAATDLRAEVRYVLAKLKRGAL